MAKDSAKTGESPITGDTGKKKTVESIYPVSELAKEAGKVFGAGVTQDIVTAAFFVAGKHEATKPEAVKIVDTFLKKGGKK